MYEETPILAQLVRHVSQSRLPLHVPGHKQGSLLPEPLGLWLGAAAKLDLTELPGLDNLHQPEGCILASQQLASSHYGSDWCFYSVNGSTAGVMAAIAGTAIPGKRVLFVNPFHQSAWRGLVLSDAAPCFLPFEFDGQAGCFAPPTASAVHSMLSSRTDICAVFLTSPTYQGLTAPVADIADAVHEFGLPLIVDEAHGPHYGLHTDLPRHSVQAGADIVIQSVHKMLPGLTQTAWVHCQGDRVQQQRVLQSLNLLQSTSPSYLLLASLDAAQAWLRTVGPDTVEASLQVLSPFQTQWSALGEYRVDPYRHWVPTNSTAESQNLEGRLRDHGVFVEYADPFGVLSVFGLGVTKRDLARYQAVFEDWQQHRSASHNVQNRNDILKNRNDILKNLFRAAHEVNWALMPREAFYAAKEYVAIDNCAGRVCAESVTPYPPGVPITWPGQSMTDSTRALLQEVRKEAFHLHGVTQDGKIAVVAEP